MRTSPPTQKRIASPPAPAPDRDQDLADLFLRASTGDALAWDRLYARLTPVLRGIARSYRLSASDAEDAVQTTWLLLLDNIGHIREPVAVRGWLTVTTRRECLRLLRGTVRECSSDDPALGDDVYRAAPTDPALIMLEAERRAIVRRALAMLPEHQRGLMALLTSDDASMDYRTVGAMLAIPVGSIGPTRARSLARMRVHLEQHDCCPGSC